MRVEQLFQFLMLRHYPFVLLIQAGDPPAATFLRVGIKLDQVLMDQFIPFEDQVDNLALMLLCMTGDEMNNRCSMTGRAIEGPGDGVWDDGEWISWDWVNSQITKQELRIRFPNVEPELVLLFQDLVDLAQHYKHTTGRYLPVFGELGELFAEIQFGIKRHKPRSQGSDGRLGNDFVEIKTITPEKNAERVTVKRKGHFNKLVVVKISAEFEFQARMMDRKLMGKGDGKRARVAWSSMKESHPEQNHS